MNAADDINECPGNQRHVAIARVGKNLFVGINKKKTHPLGIAIRRDVEVQIGIHAELDALLQVPESRRERAQLFVARLTPNNHLTYSKPCDRCMEIIRQFGVRLKNVFYTDYSGRWVRLLEHL